MKNFKEQLKVVKDNNCYVCNIIVADACESIFNFAYGDDEFERLCSVALDAYLHSDRVSADEIAIAINTWLNNGGLVEQLEDMSRWDILSAAINGWEFEH